MASSAALRALRRLVEAYDRCDSNRGRFSTTELHDMRCPQARVNPRARRACVCGAEELEAALDQAHAVLAGGNDGE